MTAGALYAPSAIGRRPGGQTDLRLHLSLSIPLRPEHMILSLRLALSLALPLRTAGRIYSFLPYDSCWNRSAHEQTRPGRQP